MTVTLSGARLPLLSPPGHPEVVSLERLQSTKKTNSETSLKTTQMKLHFCHGAIFGENATWLYFGKTELLLVTALDSIG